MQDHESNVDIRIKVARYRNAWTTPVVDEISASSPDEATEQALEKVTRFQNLHAEDRIPEVALRELIDNLIHAQYKGALISLVEGDTVRIADKGPGIEDKERAFEIGYSGAKPEVLQEIRGVGAGLGIARAAIEKAEGTVSLDDNLGGGTVVTVSMSRKPVPAEPHIRITRERLPGTLEYDDEEGQKGVLSPRRVFIMFALFEGNVLGPTAVADRINTSTSTAYRELVTLTEKDLVYQPNGFEGKYTLTELGQLIVEDLLVIEEHDHEPASKMVSEVLDKVYKTGANTLAGFDALIALLQHASTVDTKDAREDQD